MTETTNPEIDVKQLMERVRQAVGTLGPRDNKPRTKGPTSPPVSLPAIPQLARPPVLGLSRPMDPKLARTEMRLGKTRAMIEVSPWIPRMFRSFFRRQGGFNRAALETMTELTKANLQLAKRVRELTIAAEQENQWLRTLAGHRETEATWMKAVGALVANVPAIEKSISRLEGKLGALEVCHATAASALNGIRPDLDQLSESLSVLRKERDESEQLFRDLRARTNEQNESLQHHSQRMDGHDQHLCDLQEASERGAEKFEAARQQLDGNSQQLRTLQDDLSKEAELLKNACEQLEGYREHLRNLQGEIAARATQHASLEASLGRVEERHLNDSIYIKGEVSRHNALLQQWRSRSDSSREENGTEDTSPPEIRDPHRLDSFYLSFENRFRGARSQIKDRVRFYLTFLKEAKAGLAERPILDLGCGRGEWLELLRESGLTAAGVDLNTAMIAQCQERHLQVTNADAVEHLRSLTDGSYGAITGFHIIEHLPLETLIDLITETRRVLMPGGLAIFESPNCKNILVGACNFYADPTHRNPVFPETAEFILSTLGFENVELRYLTPVDTLKFDGENREGVALNELLYGPQDFSVIGYAPKMEAELHRPPAIR